MISSPEKSLLKILKTLALACMILASPFSFASGSTPVGTITQLMFYEGHQGILVQHSSMSDPDSCGRTDWFILPDTYFRFKEAYATLLAANLARKRVSITVAGCLQGLPQIKHVAIVMD
jgi:hypothetical protein